MSPRFGSIRRTFGILAAFVVLAATPVAADLSVAGALEDGQRVMYYLTGNVAGKETPLTGYAMEGLTLREVTNGRRLVQAVFKGSTLLECDIVRKGRKRLWGKAKTLMAKHINKTSNDLNPLGVELPWLDMVALSKDCRKKKKQLSKSKNRQYHFGTNPDQFATTVLKSATTRGSLYRTKPRRHSRYKLIPKPVQLDHMAKGHRPQAKHDMITPGTKWCGPSNRALSYADLGGFWQPDRCCRQHDKCTMTILPFENKHSYSNLKPFVLSHCSCDQRFRACLKMVDTGVSTFVGKMFFNFVQRQCFVLKDERVCVARNWNGKCIKYDVRKMAVLQDNPEY